MLLRTIYKDYYIIITCICCHVTKHVDSGVFDPTWNDNFECDLDALVSGGIFFD